MKSWEKEKAYCAKRAQELGAEMDAAIETLDKERFEKARQTAMRYMTRKQQSAYYLRLLQALKASKSN